MDDEGENNNELNEFEDELQGLGEVTADGGADTFQVPDADLYQHPGGASQPGSFIEPEVEYNPDNQPNINDEFKTSEHNSEDEADNV